jgi:hypothetical protein
MALLLLCARTWPDPRRPGRGLALVHGGIHWDRLIDLAVRHALVPILDREVNVYLGGDTPPPARSRLRRMAHAFQVRSVVLTIEMRRLAEALCERGLDLMAYKGPALAQQIYGDVTRRSFVDLDLLVRPEDFTHARATLSTLGYSAQAPLTPLQERALRGGECDQTLLGKTGLFVELHWAVAPPHLCFELTTADLMARSRFLDLEGTRVRVPSPEDLVILLAMNGVKDMWRSVEGLALLAALMVRYPGGPEAVDWARLQALARPLGAERMVRLALWLAVDLLEAPAPFRLAAAIADDPGLPALARAAKSRLLDEGNLVTGELAKAFFRCRARERWSDRIGHYVLRATTPTIADCTALPLPPRLWRLAGVRRPFRLLARALFRGKRAAGR